MNPLLVVRVVNDKIVELPENYLVLLLVKMTLRNTPCFGAVICPEGGYPPQGTRCSDIFEAKAIVFSEKGLSVALNESIFGCRRSAGGGSIEFLIERSKSVVEWTTRGTCNFFGTQIKPEDILVAH